MEEVMSRTQYSHCAHLRGFEQRTSSMTVLVLHFFWVSTIQEKSRLGSANLLRDVNQSMNRETHFKTRLLIYILYPEISSET